MFYSPKIYDPEAGMSQIIEAASKFHAERLVYALEFKNVDESWMERMAKEVAEYRIKLEKEHGRLKEFAKVFNQQFATVNNTCFSSAWILLKKLRSGISETKRIFQKFSPRGHRDTGVHPEEQTVSVYDHSYISTDTYQLQLFDLKSFPPCVSALCDEMKKFFDVLINCMKLCRNVLKQEERIRQDPQYCSFLFERMKETVYEQCWDLLDIIEQSGSQLTPEHNPAIADRSHYQSDEEWAATAFHKHTRRDVKKLVIKTIIDEEAGSDLTHTEIMLFGNDVERVHKLRDIIRGFDRLVPANYKRKNLPPRYIKMFLHYAGITYLQEKKAVDYFKDIYQASPNHLHNMVSYTAVNGVKLPNRPEEDEAYNSFVEQIEKLFIATPTLQNAVV